MVGKIAFMITASMKTEMMNRLRYTPTELKSMTPLQASLVLLHSVTPEQRSEALPRLEQEHREEQQRLQQEQRDQIELLARQQQQQQEQETSILDAQMSSTTDDLTEADDIRTANSESTVGTLWYQVLEHQQQHSATMHQEKDESSEETVVAMYLHEKEAELGCETWQDLANQRFQRTSGPDNINRERSTGVVTYSIRKVYKE